MLDKLKQVEDRYEELCARAEQPDFYADPKKAAAWLREQKELAPIVAAYRAYCAAQRDMQDAAELMTGQADAELKALCQEELTGAKKRAAALEQELRVLLLPHDPNDEKNVILEIRPGVGGEESALFAHSLFRMYSLYAAARGWTVELLNYNETELGGIKEADFMICGAGAYSRLKFESGVHRVQRVPETESGGRVHTSTATVAVLPEMEPVSYTHLYPRDSSWIECRGSWNTSFPRAAPQACSLQLRCDLPFSGSLLILHSTVRDSEAGTAGRISND